MSIIELAISVPYLSYFLFFYFFLKLMRTSERTVLFLDSGCIYYKHQQNSIQEEIENRVKERRERRREGEKERRREGENAWACVQRNVIINLDDSSVSAH